MSTRLTEAPKPATGSPDVLTAGDLGFLAWLGPALLLAAPHVFWRGLTAAYILPKLLFLGLGAAAVGAWALLARRPVAATPLDSPLAGLAAATVASALVSVDPWLSLIGRHGGFSGGLWGLTALLGCWYAGCWLDAPRRAALPRLALWTGAAAAVHALLQHASLDPWKIGPLPTDRSVAGLGSPVDLGGFLALLFPLAVDAARREDRSPVERAFPLLYLAGLASTGSRAAWLGAAAGAAVLFALGRDSSAPRPRLRLWAPLILAAAVSAAIAWPVMSHRSVRHSDSSRLAVWRVAWKAALERPLLGYGPGTFEHSFRLHRDPDDIQRMRGATQLQDHAHNGILDALAQGGAAGLAAWAWVCAGLAGALWAARRSPGVPTAAAAATAAAVILQVDPLSVEVLGTAALLAGASLAGPAPDASRSWRAPTALAAAGLGVALTALWIIEADRHAERAAREPDPFAAVAEYEAALAETPASTAYVVLYVNRLGDAVNAAPDAAGKAALLEKAMAAGRDIARRRPNDMKAHYAKGVAYLMAAQMGLIDRLPLAAAALDDARALDPWHEPLLQSRLEIAQRRGDAAEAADLTARLAQVRIR